MAEGARQQYLGTMTHVMHAHALPCLLPAISTPSCSLMTEVPDKLLRSLSHTWSPSYTL